MFSRYFTQIQNYLDSVLTLFSSTCLITSVQNCKYKSPKYFKNTIFNPVYNDTNKEKNIFKLVIRKCFNFIFILNNPSIIKCMIIIINIITHCLNLGSVCVILYALGYRTITTESLLPTYLNNSLLYISKILQVFQTKPPSSNLPLQAACLWKDSLSLRLSCNTPNQLMGAFCGSDMLFHSPQQGSRSSSKQRGGGTAVMTRLPKQMKIKFCSTSLFYDCYFIETHQQESYQLLLIMRTISFCASYSHMTVISGSGGFL